LPLSRKHKVIFVHIPKTAGTSIEYALGMHGNINYIGEISYTHQKKNWDTLFGDGLQHMTITELKEIIDKFGFSDYKNLGWLKWKYDILYHRLINGIGKGAGKNNNHIFEHYYKFSVVRNPYDRLVSSFFWNNPASNDIDHDTQRFHYEINKLHRNGLAASKIHYKPQYCYLYQEQKLMVDEILKFESLNNDFSRLCNKLGFFCSLQERMKGNHSKFELYYTSAIKEKVYNLYKEDFNFFGYSR
jgi:hypothetical protein